LRVKRVQKGGEEFAQEGQKRLRKRVSPATHFYYQRFGAAKVGRTHEKKRGRPSDHGLGEKKKKQKPTRQRGPKRGRG